MNEKMTITNAKYHKAIGTDTISCIHCIINGKKWVFH